MRLTTARDFQTFEHGFRIGALSASLLWLALGAFLSCADASGPTYQAFPMACSPTEIGSYIEGRLTGPEAYYTRVLWCRHPAGPYRRDENTGDFIRDTTGGWPPYPKHG